MYDHDNDTKHFETSVMCLMKIVKISHQIFYLAAKNKYDSIAFPESVPIHLNMGDVV